MNELNKDVDDKYLNSGICRSTNGVVGVVDLVVVVVVVVGLDVDVDLDEVVKVDVLDVDVNLVVDVVV